MVGIRYISINLSLDFGTVFDTLYFSILNFLKIYMLAVQFHPTCKKTYLQGSLLNRWRKRTEGNWLIQVLVESGQYNRSG